MSGPAVGQRVRLEGVTAPVWVQVPLGDVTGVVVADPFEHAHGQLVAVKLDPLPAVYGKLRELGVVSEEDEVVLAFWSELQEEPQGGTARKTAESAKNAEKMKDGKARGTAEDAEDAERTKDRRAEVER